jgi:hypothetical protein
MAMPPTSHHILVNSTLLVISNPRPTAVGSAETTTVGLTVEHRTLAQVRGLCLSPAGAVVQLPHNSPICHGLPIQVREEVVRLQKLLAIRPHP